jgi:CheY-like chemotaxis protein
MQIISIVLKKLASTCKTIFTINSIKICVYFKAYNARKKLFPIIELILYSDNTQQNTYFNAGMNDFLPKPIQKQ